MKPSADEVLTSIASRQHGLVTRPQALRAGLTDRMLQVRLKKAWLRRIVRGVYAVGPVLVQLAKERAAVLACGASAVVSHRSAAVMWRILPEAGDSVPVDVIVTRGRPASSRHVRPHRVPGLLKEEVTQLHGLPITCPTRTLLDLAGCIESRELERAVAEALALRLTDAEGMATLLSRHRRRAGTRRLRAMLEGDAPATLTRSVAEERFLALIRKARLRLPAANVVVEGHEVDFVWRAERLVVEVDGYAFHSSKHAFEKDRGRDADLMAGGFRVMRVTWRQLEREPEAILARLAQALVRRGFGGG